MDEPRDNFTREVANKYRSWQKGTLDRNKKKRLAKRKAQKRLRRKNGNHR